MQRKNSKEELWIINTTTDRDVSIGDLRITVKKGQRINILSAHYHFTKEQIDNSIKSGSIYKKRNMLNIREKRPVSFERKMVKEIVKPMILKPLRNPEISIAPPYMEELEIKEDDFFIKSDEKFAEEQSELDDMDRAPVLAVDKKFITSKIDEILDE